MGMSTAIFKKNDLVMNTQGRFTGKRGVVVDVTEDRVIVAGISKFYPNKKTSKSRYAKFFKTKQTEVFVKKMNPIHLFPSGINFDLGIDTEIGKCLSNKKSKQEAKIKLTKLFNDSSKNENVKWLFDSFKSA